jgi:hypothetical protein
MSKIKKSHIVVWVICLVLGVGLGVVIYDDYTKEKAFLAGLSSEDRTGMELLRDHLHDADPGWLLLFKDGSVELILGLSGHWFRGDHRDLDVRRSIDASTTSRYLDFAPDLNTWLSKVDKIIYPTSPEYPEMAARFLQQKPK